MSAVGGDRLEQLSARAADHAHAGHITEEHAVEILADAAARDPAVLRDAALQAQEQPDAVPLVAALLYRAAAVARHPAPVRPPQAPTARGPQMLLE